MNDSHFPSESAQERRSAPWALGLCWLIVVVSAWIVNPFRETPMEDDWAYALTLKNWMETGEYKLNGWLSASPIAPITMARAVCWFDGYSFANMRLCNLLLSWTGLAAMYSLWRLLGVSNSLSALGVLVVWSSPLYFRFSLNFMTDVPFVAWMYIGLASFGAMMRVQASRQALALAMVAGIMCTMAVLTRQFAVAILPALALTSVLQAVCRSRKQSVDTCTATDRRDGGSARLRPLLLAALAGLPVVVAALWQAYLGFIQPTWAQIINKRLQWELMSDVPRWLVELAWRPGICLLYCAFMTLPLGIICAPMIPFVARNRVIQSRFRASPWIIGAVGALAALAVSAVLSWIDRRPFIFPQLPWNFEELRKMPWFVMAPLSAILALWTIVIGASMGSCIVRDAGIFKEDPDRGALPVLVHLAMAFSFGLTLVYRQYGDEYLLIYLPYFVWLVLRDARLDLRWIRRAASALALCQLLVAVLWADILMSVNELGWQTSMMLVERQRCDPGKVAYDWKWMCYHRMDELVAESPPSKEEGFGIVWRKWEPAHRAQAEWQVVVGRAPATPPGVMPKVSYRQKLLIGVWIVSYAWETAPSRPLPPTQPAPNPVGAQGAEHE